MSPLSFYYIVYVICFQFFLSHWEKYNTGVLYLPWAYDASQVGHVGIVNIPPFSYSFPVFVCVIPAVIHESVHFHSWRLLLFTC